MEECQCQVELDFFPENEISTNRSITKPVEVLNFGTIGVGSKKWLHINITNETENESEYQVTSDPKRNPLYQVFGLSQYKYKLSGYSSRFIKVFYKPLFPNMIDIDLFNIHDDQNNTRRIKVQGNSSGPLIYSSTSFLRFHTTIDKKKGRSIFELKNKGPVATDYCIDMDNNETTFIIDNKRGNIASNRSVYINVTFQPSDSGTYSHQLNCLILNHEPVIIQLCGICTPSKRLDNVTFLPYPGETSECSYKKYMKDVQTCRTTKPLYSLSEMYLNFGSYVTDSDTLVTSLTNHTTKSITVKWENDPSFHITPKSIKIPPNKSLLFECTFCPDQSDAFYGSTLVGNVYWKDSRSNQGVVIEVPISIELRSLGHSFTDQSFWIPQLQIIPEVIILPPSLPRYPSFVTIHLKTCSHLPVSFCFVSPKKTNFIIKPMLGVVHDTTMVVIQLQSENSNKSKVYIEQWCLTLNGRVRNCNPFYIKGFSEPASAVVGDQNKIKLANIHTGCIAVIKVPLKNTCQHYLRYEFDNTIDDITINCSTGELPANEVLLLEFTYKSKCSAFLKYIITLSLHVMQSSKRIIGIPVEIPVELYVESTTSEIYCIPHEEDLKNILCCSKNITEFYIFNSGSAVIHYRLLAKCKFSEDIFNSIYLMPSVGTILPNHKAKVLLELIPTSVGCYEISIYYGIRESENCATLLDKYEKHIYTLKYVSTYPCLQIVDIEYHNFGPLFTKTTLWEIFGIDNLNDALQNIKTSQTIPLIMQCPDCEECNDTYYVIFVLKNITDFSSEIKFKRRKTCECELIEYSPSLSIRKQKYFCPHRDILNLNASDTVVQPQSLVVLQVYIKYNLEGVTTMSYNMQISHDRCIILNFIIRVLSTNQQVISKYNNGNILKMHPICLSEKDPILQSFWLYNNSDKSVPYKLDETNFNMLNNKYNYCVVNCLNSSGWIAPYTSIPILFKYTPIENNEIILSLPLKLGDDFSQMDIILKGKKQFSVYNKQMLNLPTIMHLNVPVVLSEDHIQITPFPVWSTTTRMIFIKNTLKTCFLGYSWQSAVVEGVVETNVIYRKGILKPNQSNPIIIQIRSFDQPCNIRLQLCCKLLNHSQYYLHKKSIAAYNKRQEEISGQFTITENGTYAPENEIVIQPFPELFFISAALEIVITSVADRDLHYTPQEQFTHVPQYTLQTNQYIEAQQSISSHSELKSIDNVIEKSNEIETIVSNNEEDKIDVFQIAIECIIADVLFSNIFYEICILHHQKPQIFYSQIMKGVHQSQQRTQLIQNLRNDPSPPAVTDVIKEAITDSVHDIFQLGSQVKKYPKDQYIHELRHSTKLNWDKILCECD